MVETEESDWIVKDREKQYWYHITNKKQGYLLSDFKGTWETAERAAHRDLKSLQEIYPDVPLSIEFELVTKLTYRRPRVFVSYAE